MSAYSQQRNNVTKTWILLVLFVGLVSAVCYGAGAALQAPWLAVLGFVIAIGQAVIAYFAGAAIATGHARAVEVDANQAPQIHLIVDNISKIAGVPKPRVFISPSKALNAFATGRNPENARICLNQGLIDSLSKAQLEGVIAHEMAHIANRDILVMTVTMVLTSVISFIADMSMRLLWFGGGRDRDNNNGPGAIFIYIIVLLLAPTLGVIIQLAVSRQREFLADSTAVVYTRYPAGLITALQRLYESPVPEENYSQSMAQFYISPPKRQWGKSVQNWFSSHPTIDERIEALSKM